MRNYSLNFDIFDTKISLARKRTARDNDNFHDDSYFVEKERLRIFKEMTRRHFFHPLLLYSKCNNELGLLCNDIAHLGVKRLLLADSTTTSRIFTREFVHDNNDNITTDDEDEKMLWRNKEICKFFTCGTFCCRCFLRDSLKRDDLMSGFVPIK